MKDEIKDVSNTYEVKTLEKVRMSKKVVSEVLPCTDTQKNVLFWELLAYRTRTIGDKGMITFIREIKESVK